MDFVASRRRGSAGRLRGYDRGGRLVLAIEVLESRRLLSVTISDPSFESPAQNGGYTYDLAGTSWTFAGNSGIEANGSGWRGRARRTARKPHSCRAAAPDKTAQWPGQPDARFHQQAARTRSNFKCAQRSSNGSLVQSIGLYLDGSLIGTYTPTSAGSWTTFGAQFNVPTAGNHTIAFAAINSSGDQSCFLDNLIIGNYSSPAIATQAAATPDPVSGTTTD